MNKDDLVIAQNIVSLSLNNNKDTLFHEISPIYIKSNERINVYDKYFKDRNNILSVISCGDQIINMIYHNALNIDAFDISIFPKHYLYLKLAAIKSINKDNYIDFFYNSCNDQEKYDDLYFYNIRNNLNKCEKEFWDGLLNYFDWYDIVSSQLFSNEVVSISDVIRQNTYLKDNNSNKLKDKIDNVNINVFNGNILNMNINKSYDLIYLSNIINYVKLNDYKKLLNRLKLNESGIILSYLYNDLDKYNNYFNESYYYIDKIENKGPGILIKKK